MRAAIYARYSSENQSEKSIDDQTRVCKNYIREHGMTIDDEHIYVDEAISGSLIHRPGLQALEEGMENKEFDAVVVDDLSRLSRSNHQMLTLVLKFDYHQVRLISVSDGTVTGDENSKLGIHIRGFINELYLDDLRKKTMPGLEGQKLRGFSTGEHVYGYRTEPVGELKVNKKGQAKYEGMVHQILAERVGFLLPRRSRFSSEAGHPHCHSLCSLFFPWKRSGWLRIPLFFLSPSPLPSPLRGEDTRNQQRATIYGGRGRNQFELLVKLPPISKYCLSTNPIYTKSYPKRQPNCAF